MEARHPPVSNSSSARLVQSWLDLEGKPRGLRSSFYGASPGGRGSWC
jgi:hypothetical protein